MKVLIIAPILEATGNQTTARRISKQLDELGYTCTVKGISELPTVHEFCDWIRHHDVQCVLALHAYRTSHLMQGCDIVPYSIVFGGTDVNEHSKDRDKLTVMTSVVEKANCLVAFTDSLMSEARRLWPHVSNRIIKQPQAVYTNPSAFDFRHHLKHFIKPLGVMDCPIVLLLVASLRPVKAPLYVAQSVADWHEEDERVHLVIVGPRVSVLSVPLGLNVEYASEVETTISRLQGVYLLPPLPQPDVHAAIQSADILVNTSLSEGTPQAALEAMQLRTPVLVRDIPGNAAIVTDRRTGLLFSSPEEFVLKAKELLSSPTLQQCLTEEAYEFISRVHSWDEEKQTYHRVVTNMIHKQSEPNTDDQLTSVQTV